MAALRKNVSLAEYCPWCDSAGFIFLHRYVSRVNGRGEPYREQVLAACGFCELGHAKHAALGGPWNYQKEEVDVLITEDRLRRLSPDEQAAYRRMRKAVDAYQARQSQMNMDEPSE